MDGDPLDTHLLQACQYLERGQDPWENAGVCFFLMEVGRRWYFLVDVLSDIGKASQQQSHQGKHLSTFTKWSIMFSCWQLRGMSARNRSSNLAGLAHLPEYCCCSSLAWRREGISCSLYVPEAIIGELPEDEIIFISLCSKIRKMKTAHANV